MKTTSLLALLVLPACVAMPDHHRARGAPRANHRVSVYVGERELDDDFFKPVEEQTVTGIEYSSETPGYEFGYEIGVMSSYEEEDKPGMPDIEGRTGEVYGGIHKSWGDLNVHPYFGAGLAIIAVEREVTGMSGRDDDGSLAAYGHVGLQFDVSDYVYLGVDVRFLFGSDIDITGVSSNAEDADYEQIALTIGFSF